jgi:hypothetical protein
MCAMKEIGLFLLLFVSILSSCQKENIEPLKVDIPDNEFLIALIELGVDTDGDSIISKVEAEAINYLSISHRSIPDFTGISEFINLDSLHCFDNQLTDLGLGWMPTLSKVCVLLIPFPPETIDVHATGSPNVYFTTDCSK